MEERNMVGGLEYGPEESDVISEGGAPEWGSGPDAPAADTPEAAGEEVVYAEDLVLEDMRESGEGLVFGNVLLKKAGRLFRESFRKKGYILIVCRD